MDILLTTPWIPPEWIRAHGLQPRFIGAADNFQPGSSPLSAGVCSFAEAAVRFAEASSDSAVIFSSTCDQLRRAFDAVAPRAAPRAFLFNLPATWQSPAAVRIFRSELQRLGKFLQALGGRAPSPDALRREMRQSSAVRNRLLRSAPAASPRGFAEALTQFHWDGSFAPPPPAAPSNAVPIALLGGPFLARDWKWLDELQSAGARVSLNATEFGERSLSPPLDLADASIPPFDALVRACCENIVDVFQRPNKPLYAWLNLHFRSRRVRGIVLWHYTACDLWRAEAQTLRETFRLPLLLLEAGAEPGAAPRDLNRLQAFVETLR
jgi:hypothetical protein